MKIPAGEIAALLQDCRTEFLRIPDDYWKDANGKPIPGRGLTVPLTMFGNKFASFEWLKYHPIVYIGGWIDGAADKGTLRFYPKELGQAPEDNIQWYNKVVGGLNAAWHTLTADNDEIIEAL